MCSSLLAVVESEGSLGYTILSLFGERIPDVDSPRPNK
jgi:hypothetical protein